MNLDDKLLFPHEINTLLEALRRDYRTQYNLALSSGEWTEWHRNNARMVLRVLEVLNPKSNNPQRNAPRMQPMHLNARRVQVLGHDAELDGTLNCRELLTTLSQEAEKNVASPTA